MQKNYAAGGLTYTTGYISAYKVLFDTALTNIYKYNGLKPATGTVLVVSVMRDIIRNAMGGREIGRFLQRI